MQQVRVLILVDQNIAELLLIVCTNILKSFQKLDGLEDDVVKVQSVRLLETLLVLGVDERDLLHPVVAGEGRRALEFRRLLPLVLGLGDDAQHQTRCKDLFVQTHVAQDVLHHALGVARVVDRKAPVKAQLLDVAPENAAAGRVEGHGPHVQRFRAQHPRQTLLQLVRGLVGERDGDDAPRSNGPERAERVRAGLLRRLRRS